MDFIVEIKKPMGVLWLKSVVGFNAQKHCFPCLIGEPLRHIIPVYAGTRQVGQTLTGSAETKFAYLCGLTYDFTGQTVYNPGGDIHLGLMSSPGDTVQFYNDWLSVVVQDARRLIIPDLPENAVNLGPDFTTCMNYKFGYQYILRNAPPEFMPDQDLRKLMVVQQIKASKGDFTWSVTQAPNGELSCNCPGFYHRRKCHHITDYLAGVKQKELL